MNEKYVMRKRKKENERVYNEREMRKWQESKRAKEYREGEREYKEEEKGNN